VRSFLIAVIVALLTLPVAAQTVKPAAKPPSPAQEARANDDIIKLAAAGMSEDIILGVVSKADKSKYDTSADAILKLKAAGVTERVIAAILGINVHPASSQSVPTQKEAPPVAPPLATSTQHVAVSVEQTPTRSVEGREAGIYVDQGKGMVQLEPTVYSSGKTGNKFLYGATRSLVKGSIKAVVRAPKANQRLHVTTPTFYFYFENKGAGLSNTAGVSGALNGASSPNEFVLVRMDISKDEREFIIAESGAFGDRTGVRSKDTIDFSIEKLGPGIYKVIPKSPLDSGEYCFFYALTATKSDGTGKLFDFGVDIAANSR